MKTAAFLAFCLLFSFTLADASGFLAGPNEMVPAASEEGMGAEESSSGSSSSSSSDGDWLDKTGQALGGVLKGIGSGLGMGDVSSCINDGGASLGHFGDAVDSFANDDMQGGMNSLGQGLSGLPDAINKCASAYKDVRGDVGKISSAVESFSNPWSFAYHTGKDLLLNGSDIYHEVRSAASDFEQGNYSGFGYNVGLAAEKTFIG